MRKTLHPAISYDLAGVPGLLVAVWQRWAGQLVTAAGIVPVAVECGFLKLETGSSGPGVALAGEMSGHDEPSHKDRTFAIARALWQWLGTEEAAAGEYQLRCVDEAHMPADRGGTGRTWYRVARVKPDGSPWNRGE